SVTLRIGGLHCASCVARIERSLCALDGVIKASVNLVTEQATVEYVPRQVTSEEIKRRILGLGYDLPDGAADASHEEEHAAHHDHAATEALGPWRTRFWI